VTSVLVVDDEPQIRRALSLNLGVRHYDVREAATGEEALAIVAAEQPDVVLLDLGLPGMNGMAVLETLRQYQGVAVIVLTARDDELSRIDALEAGADDYVTKPFGMTDLVSRVRAVLKRKAAR
jgi:two-component system KDP operon response regulator KdpE